MRKVRCVSPHGGAHHGVLHDGRPALPGHTGPLDSPPHEGGYIDSSVLGRVAVGAEVDAPDAPAFIADGFHFIDVTSGGADECKTAGDGCWCGRHRHLEAPAAAAAPARTPPPPPSAPAGGEE